MHTEAHQREAILRKAAKLMAFQSGMATPAEVELAAQRLGELLHAHNLTIQDVRVEALRTGIRAEPTKSGYVHRPRWVKDLASGVAHACGCRVIYSQETEEEGDLVYDIETFIGHDADVAVARYFYDVLNRQLPDMASVHVRAYRPVLRQRAKRSFLVGVVHAVVGRLGAMLQPKASEDAMSSASGRGLMVAKHQAIELYLEETYPRLRTTSRRRFRADQVDMQALQAGVRAGHDLPLQHGVRTQATQVCIDLSANTTNTKAS